MTGQSKRVLSRRGISVQNRAAATLFKRSRWISLLFLSGGLIAAALLIAIPSMKPPIVDHTNARMVEIGRRIYTAECASCHGVNLEGQPNWQVRLANGKLPAPPHDPSGHTWHHSDKVLFDITKKGPASYPDGYQTDMPAFGGRLSGDQIAAVLAFIKSTWPTEILQRQPKARN